jgi:hypothetical protein
MLELNVRANPATYEKHVAISVSGEVTEKPRLFVTYFLCSIAVPSLALRSFPVKRENRSG